jgi:hypothetical protein
MPVLKCYGYITKGNAFLMISTEDTVHTQRNGPAADLRLPMPSPLSNSVVLVCLLELVHEPQDPHIGIFADPAALSR